MPFNTKTSGVYFQFKLIHFHSGLLQRNQCPHRKLFLKGIPRYFSTRQALIVNIFKNIYFPIVVNNKPEYFFRGNQSSSETKSPPSAVLQPMLYGSFSYLDMLKQCMNKEQLWHMHTFFQIYIKLEFPECIMCQPSQSIVSLTCL